MTNKQVKMEQHAQEPLVCQELDVLKTSRPDPAESPPPNCAICLGTCTNKCFTDCCLHQFCFSCLLEWSKIKAECPLCKQPFKSIIYNIKSNLEYEEHIIANPERENQDDLDMLTLNDPTDYLFLPNGPRPQRHFQYRTTFTLEPGGEFAIQQLLLSHPRTNSISFPADRYPYIRFNSSSTHSVDQRRNIYIENWWVDPQSDVTGRYRVCSPHFFRENPAQAHRIIPWLNRELTSLINHTLIYTVQQEILDMLCQYPILSSQFRSRIVQHLGTRTDHFIHEFYNFARSPYDMIGYDRHATYRRHRPLPIYDLSDEDSDVHVVDSPENDDCIFIPNRAPEVIVIDSESSGNDSDVIMRTPTPPPIVDLVNDSSTEEEENAETIIPQQQHQQELQQQQQQQPSLPQQQQQPIVENDRIETRSPQLPIKIRLKRSKSSAEICKNYKHKEKRRLKRSHSSSSTSSENSSSTESYNSSSKSSSSDYYKYVLKKKKSKLSNRKHSNKSDTKYLSKSSKSRYKKLKSDAKVKKSKRNSKKSKKQKKSKRRDSEKRHRNIKIEKSDTSSSISSLSDVASSSSSSSSDGNENYHRRKKPKLFYEIKTECSIEQQNSQTETSQYEQQSTENYSEATLTTATSPSTVTTFPSSTETSSSPAAATAAASTFSSTNIETNSDHWSTTSIASSCPSSNVPQDLGIAGPSNGVSVQSMVVVKDKNGSLWCRSNYQPSKRFGLYRPDLNRSSDNSSDSD